MLPHDNSDTRLSYRTSLSRLGELDSGGGCDAGRPILLPPLRTEFYTKQSSKPEMLRPEYMVGLSGHQKKLFIAKPLHMWGSWIRPRPTEPLPSVEDTVSAHNELNNEKMGTEPFYSSKRYSFVSASTTDVDTDAPHNTQLDYRIKQLELQIEQLKLQNNELIASLLAHQTDDLQLQIRYLKKQLQNYRNSTGSTHRRHQKSKFKKLSAKELRDMVNSSSSSDSSFEDSTYKSKRGLSLHLQIK